VQGNVLDSRAATGIVAEAVAEVDGSIAQIATIRLIMRERLCCVDLVGQIL
jgi:hypothetical protein